MKEYLAKSNYKGQPIRWLTATEQHSTHYLTAVTAAQQLKRYGINVAIKEEPIATYLQDRANADKMDAFSSFLPTYIDPVSIASVNASYPGFWTDPKKMELMHDSRPRLTPISGSRFSSKSTRSPTTSFPSSNTAPSPAWKE